MAFAAPSTLSALFGAPVATQSFSTRIARNVSRPRPRVSRSHIVALGPSPTPPSPPEKESSEESEETVNPVDPVNGTTPAASAGEAETPTEEAAAPVPPAPASSDDLPNADDILSSPSFLKKKLEIVEKELLEARESVAKGDEALKAEKADYLRLVADFDNFRRRNTEEMKKLETKSTAKVCKAILGVLDNFDRALDSVTTQTEREASLHKSYGAINKQLTEALGKLGVACVDPLGEKFDPGFHDAIQKLESQDYFEGTVCEVYQKGYKIGESLVRAAVVAVSTGPGPSEVVGEGEEGEVTDVAATEEKETPGEEEESKTEESK